jgi:hypothetical protein
LTKTSEGLREGSYRVGGVADGNEFETFGFSSRLQVGHLDESDAMATRVESAPESAERMYVS